MPALADGSANVTRAGEALRFTGVVSRANVAALWRQLPPLDGVDTLDLTEVASIDSAGLALLAQVASGLGTATIRGTPAGLAELRSAYRLDAALGFGAA